MLLTVVLLCAFLVGLAIGGTSTCSVAAAKEVLVHRRGTTLYGFAIAVGAAGIATLSLRWFLGGSIHLAQNAPISAPLVLGAMLIGIGALINDACLLGTLARIGRGELRFLALPAGLALGYAVVDRRYALGADPTHAPPAAMPPLAAWASILVFLLLLGWAWQWHRRSDRASRPGASRRRILMLAMGGFGALLFALEPHWVYGDSIHAIVRRGGRLDIAADMRAAATALALLGGALAGAVAARSFVFRQPSLAGVAQSIVGGAMMAIGGTLIPGGNDTLLLAAIPAGSVGGIVAYLIMVVTVLAGLWLVRRQRHRSAR